MNYPAPFLVERIKDDARSPAVICLCAGYQGQAWRAKQLADHIFSWIPHVALTDDEKLSFNISNWEEHISHAAAKIYKTKKTLSRGEVGEILLHIACLLNLKAEPLVCKLVLKTSSNDTVKGFDGVHLLRGNDGSFYILLGESKFWANPKRGIKDAIQSLKTHILSEFLDTEKAMLLSHIPRELKTDAALLSLFKKQTSSDELLARAIFPVLIGYQSKTIGHHKSICAEFQRDIETEVGNLHAYFKKELGATAMPTILMIFVPMGSKKALITRFYANLIAYQ